MLHIFFNFTHPTKILISSFFGPFQILRIQNTSFLMPKKFTLFANFQLFYVSLKLCALKKCIFVCLKQKNISRILFCLKGTYCCLNYYIEMHSILVISWFHDFLFRCSTQCSTAHWKRIPSTYRGTRAINHRSRLVAAPQGFKLKHNFYALFMC